MFRNISIIIVTAISLAQGQEITIKPIAFGIHRTAGELWTTSAQPISLAGWGLMGSIDYGNFHIESEQVLTRFFGIGQLPNNFNPEQSFSWGQYATSSFDELDIDYSSFILEWRAENFRAFVGKTSTNLGPAQHSLMLSKKVPSFPMYGFKWQINDRLNYHFIRGELFSGIVDPYQSDAAEGVPGTPRARQTFLNRYLATHRLDIQLTDELSVGFSESLIYGGRNVALIYSLPFMLLYSAEHFFRDQDNLQMGLDFTWMPLDNWKVYGAFMMDEWRPQSTFKGDVNRNWFAWQGGIESTSLIAENDRFSGEFIWTDHRVYRHKFPINNFYSHDVPVGAWIGPHAQSIAVEYTLPILSSYLSLEYLYAKRGEQTDSMLVQQYYSLKYERFSGPVETLNNFTLSLMKEVYTGWWLELGVSLINWDHAGFNPFDPDQVYDDVEKTSFTVGFYHNFSIPNYRITRFLERFDGD